MPEGLKPEGDGDSPHIEPVLDMSRACDRTMFASALRRGWLVSPERKAAYFAALDDLIREARDITDPGLKTKMVVGANKILQAEQAAALRDVQQQDEYERLDKGLATARNEHEHTHRHTIDYDQLRRRLVASQVIDNKLLPTNIEPTE